MITPSFGLTATERVLPKLALDFTTATLDPRVTFTRSGNTATYTNSSGVITAINADLPRFDYNPTTLICQGLLIEEARTNIVLNSLINGTILSTQIVTTSAIAYTLSFYGTGSIVLTGTHSATVTGTGVYPSRKTYTFTPTAGALTLTVSGTVQYAQLEAGSFATSFIPTLVAPVTRNADVATMTGTNFSDWYNASEGSWSAQVASYNATGYREIIVPYLAATPGIRYILEGNGSKVGWSGYNGTSWVFDIVNQDYLLSGTTTVCSYKINKFQYSSNGAATTSTSSGTPWVVDSLRIGSNTSTAYLLNGWIKKLYYWPQALTNNEVQAFSK